MKAWGKTHKGAIRPTNQDCFLIDINHEESIGVFTVCDGMGGANAGNVAARCASQKFSEDIKRNLKNDMDSGYIKEILKNAVALTNTDVYELSKMQPEFAGMGTTIVGIVSTDDKAIIANVGDSRAYLIDTDGMHQITQDHSYIEEMVRRGKMSEEEAKSHPGKNLITRAIGVDKTVECDVFEVALKDGDIILICTDGLTGLVSDEEIYNIVMKSDNLANSCDDLIEKALACGGHDNITTVLFTK